MTLKPVDEIRKRAAAWLDLIMKCANGCGRKPQGFYCNTCYMARCRYEELEWALGEEGRLSRDLATELKNTR